MRYTSNEKLDFDEINKKVKSTGFSDRAKKYIGSLLLAAQITGVSPALADNLNTIQSNSQSNIIELKDDMITVDSLKEEYRKILENSTLLEKHKKIMLKNLEEGLDSVEIANTSEKGWAGVYFFSKKKIQLDDDHGQDMLDVRIHEMMHAASTIRDSDKVKNMGVQAWRKREIDDLDSNSLINQGYRLSGMGFNEAITEYLTNRVISENGIKPAYIAYSSLVVATKDIIAVYSDEPVIDAYLGSPEKLEELMAKDGVSYTRFLELMDEQYRIEFKERNKGINGELRTTYRPIGELIKDIREKHIQRNPNIVLPEFEWGKRYRGMPGGAIEDQNKIGLAPGFGCINDDLKHLYGNAYTNASIGGGNEILRHLMAKDGIDWDNFYKKLDDYASSNNYEIAYETYEVTKEKKSQLYLDIGKDIEKARLKRIQENPDIDLPESQWVNFYITDLGGSMEDVEQIKSYGGYDYKDSTVSLDESASVDKEGFEQFNDRTSDTKLNILEKVENSLFAWFKDIRDKIIGRFKKTNEVLFLNSGDEKIESNASKRNEFLDSIKADESKVVYEQTTKDVDREKMEETR